MSCLRCNWSQPERFGYEPNTLYRCPQCLFQWDEGLAMIQARFAALEAEHAKDRARIERLERLIAYTASEVQEILPSLALDPWAQTLRDAICAELAEIDRARGGG